jgi:hypothetical protein
MEKECWTELGTTLSVVRHSHTFENAGNKPEFTLEF